MSKRHRHCPHCGCELVKPRYPKYHRFFFAVMQAAFENWPETHPLKPRNSEVLRGMLMVEVGEYDAVGNGYRPGSDNVMKLLDFIDMAIHAGRLAGYAKLAVRDDGTAEARYPRSIAWDQMDQKEFGPIAEKIFELVEAETHLRIADLKRGA